jgi:metal-dependent amidase/aminoacylase/carboxypeptidase family protein
MKSRKGVFWAGICLSLLVGMVSFSWGATVQVVPPEPSNITAVKKATDAKIDAYSGKMVEMNDWMYKNPEPGFLEFKAAELLTGELKKNGFEVEMGVPGLDPKFDSFKIIGGLDPGYKGSKGLPTAFKAKYKGKAERPVIGFLVEYDALRDNPPFHGCQHNQQGPAGLGAAIALARVMEENKIPGSIWVIGTPAEEVGPPSKSAMASM